MAITYEPIQTKTLIFDAAEVEFIQIPSTFTDLVLVTSEKQTAASARSSAIQFNSDFNSNYSQTGLYGTGSSALSYRIGPLGKIYYAYWSYSTSAAINLNSVIYINNYSSNTTNKTIISRNNSTTTNVEIVVGLWNSVNVIDKIVLHMDNVSNFAAGSTFSLYGVKGV